MELEHRKLEISRRQELDQLRASRTANPRELMDLLLDLTSTFAAHLQSPTLAFLLGGMLVAALGSKLDIPVETFRFIVFMLLMRIGLEAGMEIREAEVSALVLPGLVATLIGCLVHLATGFSPGGVVLPAGIVYIDDVEVLRREKF